MKKRNLVTIILLAALFIMAGFPFFADQAEAAEAEQLQQVNIISTVNARTEPHTSSTVIGVLRSGTIVNLIQEIGAHWLYVELNGQTGYISSSPRYVQLLIEDEEDNPSPQEPTEPIEDPEEETIGAQAKIISTVNARTEPHTGSTVIGVLRSGTIVNVIQQIGSHWLYVELNGQRGYISSSSQYVHILPGSGEDPSEPIEPETPHPETPEPEQPDPELPNPDPETTLVDQIIATGINYLGTPYQYGATAGQTNTFDCSSFIQTIFRENGISLPRNSRQQSTVGESITTLDELEKGDLLFFRTGFRSDGLIDHVAVYMGDGNILHSIPNGGVQIHHLSGTWLRTIVAAKRIL